MKHVLLHCVKVYIHSRQLMSEQALFQCIVSTKRHIKIKILLCSYDLV
jgi:hypothetical protein